MLKKSWVTFVLATSLLGLTGCNGDNNATDNNRNNLGVNDVRNDRNNGTNLRNVRNNNNNGMNVRNVSNRNLRVSTRAARNVDKLREVDMAHVIIRNNDAYVAVRLNNNRNNQGTTGTTNGGNDTNNGTANITGTSTNGRNNDINARGAGTSRNGNYPSTTGITGTGNTGNALNLDVTDNDDDGTIGLRGTNDGTTGTRDTGINGGNGTDATGYKRVSNSLDQRIADQVRTADKKIHNVYISYDPNFFNRMTNYTTDIRNGRNRDGLWNDFTNTIENIFR